MKEFSVILCVWVGSVPLAWTQALANPPAASPCCDAIQQQLKGFLATDAQSHRGLALLVLAGSVPLWLRDFIKRKLLVILE